MTRISRRASIRPFITSLAQIALCVSAGIAASGASAAVSTGVDFSLDAWKRVLTRHVDSKGGVDFDALRRDPEDLRTRVRWLESNGPRTTPENFPERRDRIAYYIDAYNALAMWNVVRGRFIPRQKIRFFFMTRFRIDGETRSLYSLENDVIRPLGEPRVHFALNCMVRSCPRLQREPWGPGDVEVRLAEATREFFAESRNFALDHERREVLVSELLDFYPEDFRRAAPTLLDFLRAHGPEPIPEGYRLRFIDYDWTLNDRRAAGSQAGGRG